MAESRSKPRYVFIDGLRGIAALSVVLFHVYAKNLLPMTGFEFPEPIHSLFRHGNLGVHVFFVISGFVIAQSILGERVTPRYVGWFAARRSLRLDPPYWATIVAMIALSYISNHLQHDRAMPMPTVGQLIAHLFYAQGFLNYAHVVPVFWTLCLEIQFYLVLVVSVGVLQNLKIPYVRWVWFSALWLVGLMCAAGWLDLHPALFTAAWPFFFLGVIVNWVHNGTARPGAFVLVVLSALALETYAPLQISVALVTALVIWWVARADQLSSLTMGRVVQYLGRISYSLYLVHMLVGTPLCRFGVRHFGRHMDMPRAIVLTVLATAVSIVVAHIMYVVVERPSIALSHRLRRFKERTS